MRRFAIGAMLMFTAVAAIGFTKMDPVSDEDCVKQSELIVVGKVKDVLTREKFPEEHEITIEVTKTLKGKAAATVKLQMPGIAGNVVPKAGDEKIFLLNPIAGGKDYKMAVGVTLFSVRDVSEQEKIEKLIAAQAEKK